jgi:hypothetical protein
MLMRPDFSQKPPRITGMLRVPTMKQLRARRPALAKRVAAVSGRRAAPDDVSRGEESLLTAPSSHLPRGAGNSGFVNDRRAA